jgi:MFS family permease
MARSPAIRGGPVHRVYSVVVFIVLASLDNVAIGLVPPLYDSIGDDLGVSTAGLGLAIGASYLVSAGAAVGWAYIGDRTHRKPVLMVGTLIWAAGTAATAASHGFAAFLGSQLLAAVGLGAVASVGFSVVSDLISPRRRGLVMSFWGLSQGVGTVCGTMLGGLLGAADWRRPFVLLTGVGIAASVAYLFTYDIRRGQSDPELAGMLAAGGEYEYRISRADLPHILGRRTNVWLTLQGLTAQFAFGSLIWLPVLLKNKAEHLGLSAETAVAVGAVYATLFQLGGLLSIAGGLVGDRLQRRTPRGRALVAAVGILAAIPFYLVLFFMPLRVNLADGAGGGAVVRAVLLSVVTEPTMALTFLLAVVALALTSANAPNWYALIVDVNPPEHRGTVFSLGNLVNGVGRAAGNGLVGLVFRGLQGAFPPPANYAVGLAIFQLFFVPTGVMYWLASRTSPADIAEVHRTLRARAAEAAAGRTDDGATAVGPAR